MNDRTKKALEDLKQLSDDYGGEIASVATSAAGVISELSYQLKVMRQKFEYLDNEYTYTALSAGAHIHKMMQELENIDSMPPVKPVSRWIPVSERLPDCDALFCDRYGDIYRGHYNKGDRTFFEDGFMDRVKDVVAWMPLPEPYRESEGLDADSD